MKEIISAVVVIVGIWGGTRVLADFYETVRKAALEKASQGLPSLADMNDNLHRPRAPQPGTAAKKPSDTQR
jgi:hypothetical protein